MLLSVEFSYTWVRIHDLSNLFTIISRATNSNGQSIAQIIGKSVIFSRNRFLAQPLNLMSSLYRYNKISNSLTVKVKNFRQAKNFRQKFHKRFWPWFKNFRDLLKTFEVLEIHCLESFWTSLLLIRLEFSQHLQCCFT